MQEGQHDKQSYGLTRILVFMSLDPQLTMVGTWIMAPLFLHPLQGLQQKNPQLTMVGTWIMAPLFLHPLQGLQQKKHCKFLCVLAMGEHPAEEDDSVWAITSHVLASVDVNLQTSVSPILDIVLCSNDEDMQMKTLHRQRQSTHCVFVITHYITLCLWHTWTDIYWMNCQV